MVIDIVQFSLRICEIFCLDNMILWNFDKGLTNQKKDLSYWPYRMNGNVEYAASGWEMYLGRNVHMSGFITWYGPPGTPGSIAPGEFRIN